MEKIFAKFSPLFLYICRRKFIAMKRKDLKLRIEEMDAESIFFVSDFLDITSDKEVSKMLSELEVQEVIKRLAKGIYCKPRVTSFGPLYPPISKIVEAVAQRDHAQVLPSGATAANMLGISVQVTLKYTFITSGSSRVLTVDGTVVTLKRAVPRNFAFKTRLAALIVQALKATGEENVGEEEVSALKRAIDLNEEKEMFRADVQQMPIWMKRIIKPLI